MRSFLLAASAVALVSAQQVEIKYVDIHGVEQVAKCNHLMKLRQILDREGRLSDVCEWTSSFPQMNKLSVFEKKETWQQLGDNDQLFAGNEYRMYTPDDPKFKVSGDLPMMPSIEPLGPVGRDPPSMEEVEMQKQAALRQRPEMVRYEPANRMAQFAMHGNYQWMRLPEENMKLKDWDKEILKRIEETQDEIRKREDIINGTTDPLNDVVHKVWIEEDQKYRRVEEHWDPDLKDWVRKPVPTVQNTDRKEAEKARQLQEKKDKEQRKIQRKDEVKEAQRTLPPYLKLLRHYQTLWTLREDEVVPMQAWVGKNGAVGSSSDRAQLKLRAQISDRSLNISDHIPDRAKQRGWIYDEIKWLNWEIQWLKEDPKRTSREFQKEWRIREDKYNKKLEQQDKTFRNDLNQFIAQANNEAKQKYPEAKPMKLPRAVDGVKFRDVGNFDYARNIFVQPPHDYHNRFRFNPALLQDAGASFIHPIEMEDGPAIRERMVLNGHQIHQLPKANLEPRPVRDLREMEREGDFNGQNSDNIVRHYTV